MRAWVALVTLGVLGMGMGAHASHPGGSHLTTVGPIDPSNGFPVWYRDANGVSTELCLEPRNPLCGFAPGVVGPDNTVTLSVGSTPGGRVLGTAQVDALGNWSFRERDSTQPPMARGP